MAALLVVVFHVAGRTGILSSDTLVAHAIRPLGALGVSIFFVLSGFLLYRPFVAAHLGDRQPPVLGRFLIRRGLRIFPAYWVALAFALGFSETSARLIGDVGDFFTIAGLMQGYDAAHILGGISVAWTLTTELTFYVFLPGFALVPLALAGHRASARVRLHAQLVAVVGVAAVALVVRVLLIERRSRLIGIFPAMADSFALGMGLAVLRSWCDLGRDRLPTVEWIRRRPGVGLGAALLCFTGVIALQLPGGLVRMGLGDHLMRDGLFLLIGLSLIGPMALGADRDHPLLRVLEHPLARWLGLISYGIYLWHTIVIKEVLPLVFTDGAAGAGFWPSLWVTLGVTIAAAAVSWYLVERPVIRWGRRHERTGRQGGWAGES